MVVATRTKVVVTDPRGITREFYNCTWQRDVFVIPVDSKGVAIGERVPIPPILVVFDEDNQVVAEYAQWGNFTIEKV